MYKRHPGPVTLNKQAARVERRNVLGAADPPCPWNELTSSTSLDSFSNEGAFGPFPLANATI